MRNKNINVEGIYVEGDVNGDVTYEKGKNENDKNEKWYQSWFMKSLLVSFFCGAIVWLNFSYQLAIGVSLIIFIIMIYFNPKRFYRRLGVSSLMIGILQFPMISGKFIVPVNNFAFGYMDINNSQVSWLGILLLILSAFFIFLDYKVNTNT